MKSTLKQQRLAVNRARNSQDSAKESELLNDAANTINSMEFIGVDKVVAASELWDIAMDILEKQDVSLENISRLRRILKTK